MRASIASLMLLTSLVGAGPSAAQAPPPPLLPEATDAREDSAATEKQASPSSSDAPKASVPANASTPKEREASAENEGLNGDGDGLPADVAPPKKGARNSSPAKTAPQTPSKAQETTSPQSSLPQRAKDADQPDSLTQRPGATARDLTFDDVDWTLWTGAGVTAGAATLGVGALVSAVVGGFVAADIGRLKRSEARGLADAKQAKGIADVSTGLFAFGAAAALATGAVFVGLGLNRLEEARYTPVLLGGRVQNEVEASEPATTSAPETQALPATATSKGEERTSAEGGEAVEGEAVEGEAVEGGAVEGDDNKPAAATQSEPTTDKSTGTEAPVGEESKTSSSSPKAAEDTSTAPQTPPTADGASERSSAPTAP